MHAYTGQWFSLCMLHGCSLHQHPHWRTQHPHLKLPSYGPAVTAQQAVRHCELLQLNHPDYSGDLCLSDYFMCRNAKFRLRGTRFTDAESVKVVVEACLERQDGKVFFQGVKSLERKWKMH